MNRITRIATFALSLAATGAALADSPTPDLPYTPASTAPLARVSGVTHDFDFVAAPVASTRSRAEVNAETLAAIADGSLRAHGEHYAGVSYPSAARARAASAQTMAAAAKR